MDRDRVERPDQLDVVCDVCFSKTVRLQPRKGHRVDAGCAQQGPRCGFERHSRTRRVRRLQTARARSLGDDGARVAVKNNGPVFRLKNGTYKIELAADHRQLLTQLVEQLRDSLATTTDDANLRRLFPTAYNNDAKKDAEYQRLMRDELLESRLAAIDVTIKVIAQEDEISAEEIDAFARSINSLRLVLGTTLDIAESDYGSQSDAQQSENSDSDEASEADEFLIQKELYEYLGWLLEWTVTAQNPQL